MRRTRAGVDGLVDRQRIDKWLWHARVVRTRQAAAALANSGQVRINGTRIDAASRGVKPGDVVTVVLGRLRVLKVAGFAERRGSPAIAARLYNDLTPDDLPDRSLKEPHAKRPDKSARRELRRLKHASGED